MLIFQALMVTNVLEGAPGFPITLEIIPCSQLPPPLEVQSSTVPGNRETPWIVTSSCY